MKKDEAYLIHKDNGKNWIYIKYFDGTKYIEEYKIQPSKEYVKKIINTKYRKEKLEKILNKINNKVCQ